MAILLVINTMLVRMMMMRRRIMMLIIMIKVSLAILLVIKTIFVMIMMRRRIMMLIIMIKVSLAILLVIKTILVMMMMIIIKDDAYNDVDDNICVMILRIVVNAKKPLLWSSLFDVEMNTKPLPANRVHNKKYSVKAQTQNNQRDTCKCTETMHEKNNRSSIQFYTVTSKCNMIIHLQHLNSYINKY